MYGRPKINGENYLWPKISFKCNFWNFIGLACKAIAFHSIALFIFVFAAVSSIIGLVLLLWGFHYSPIMICCIFILLLIPIINLITLLVLNAKATKTLRKAGYKVGFFGVSDENSNDYIDL